MTAMADDLLQITMQDIHDRMAGSLQAVIQMCRTVEGSLPQTSPSEHLHVPTEPGDVLLVLGVRCHLSAVAVAQGYVR